MREGISVHCGVPRIEIQSVETLFHRDTSVQHALVTDSNWPINTPEDPLNTAALDCAFGYAQGLSAVEWAV